MKTIRVRMMWIILAHKRKFSARERVSLENGFCRRHRLRTSSTVAILVRSMWHELFNVWVNATNVHIHGKRASGGIPRILGTASGEKSQLCVIGTVVSKWLGSLCQIEAGYRKTISNAATNWIASNLIHRNDRCRWWCVRKVDLRIERKSCATGMPRFWGAASALQTICCDFLRNVSVQTSKFYFFSGFLGILLFIRQQMLR